MLVGGMGAALDCCLIRDGSQLRNCRDADLWSGGVRAGRLLEDSEREERGER